jgi:WD40 repeat protein
MGYDAFISYSHTADGTLASALQSALHRFAKPWYKLLALHIFRDQTNLAVNPGLWSSIRDAFDRSSFFILLASPEAAASPWVAKEAEYWLAGKGLSHLLIVLTRGTLEWDRAAGSFRSENTSALPPTLCNSFPEEPLYLDLRWTHEPGVRLRLREPRFHEAVLQLTATLRNQPKDELDGADLRYRRQARVLTLFGVAAVFVAALVAMRQTRISHVESRQNVAASLAAESAKVLADSPHRAREAALLAIESDRLNPSFASNQALRAAVSLLPAGAQFYKPDESNPDERVRDVALSGNGSWVAVARDDGSTQLIDLKTHKAAGYLQPDETPGATMEFSGDGKDGSPDNNSVVSVAFDGTGAMLASGSRDGLVHVWSVPAGRELLRIRHGAPVSQVAFRPSSNQLLTADLGGHVRIFDAQRPAVLADMKLPGRIAAAAFAPGGELVAALSSEGGISVIDPTHARVVRTMAGGEAGFNLAFSKSGKRLATSNGTFAFVWDVTTGRQLLKATHSAASETLDPQQWIVSAAISGDGRFLAYGGRADKSVRVWEVESGRQVLEVRHDSAVAAVAFNTDTTRLGTGSYDGTARVWEFPSGRELERLPHAGGAEVVVFSTAIASRPAEWRDRSRFRRRAARIVLLTSRPLPKCAASRLARMAGAVPSAQRRTLPLWSRLLIPVGTLCALSGSTALRSSIGLSSSTRRY